MSAPGGTKRRELVAALRGALATLALGAAAVLLSPALDEGVVVVLAVIAGAALAALMARARPRGFERAARLALQSSSLVAAVCVVMPRVSSLPLPWFGDGPSASGSSRLTHVVSVVFEASLPWAGTSPLLAAAALLVVAGSVVVAASLRALLARGGSADPFDPPLALCTTGLYAHLRHPMQLGQICVVVGAALIEGSGGALASAIAFSLILVGPVRFLEEDELAARFGDEFLDGRRGRRNRRLAAGLAGTPSRHQVSIEFTAPDERVVAAVGSRELLLGGTLAVEKSVLLSRDQRKTDLPPCTDVRVILSSDAGSHNWAGVAPADDARSTRDSRGRCVLARSSLRAGLGPEDAACQKRVVRPELPRGSSQPGVFEWSTRRQQFRRATKPSPGTRALALGCSLSASRSPCSPSSSKSGTSWPLPERPGSSVPSPPPR